MPYPPPPLTVQKARQLRQTVKTVSWDWLEDSLLRRRRMKERDYLLMPAFPVLEEREAKQRRKELRRENIREGCEFFFPYPSFYVKSCYFSFSR